MKIMHLLKKTVLRLRTEGFRATLHELFYSGRVMVAVEKEIGPSTSMLKTGMRSEVISRDNYRDYQDKPGVRNIIHYCKHGSYCLAVFEGDTCLGYQLWTNDNKFADLRKLGLALDKDEVYLFDLFVFPAFRGTVVPKIVSVETFNYLASVGTRKICGFFFLDNIKALWWHRAFLKCRETKRVPASRFLFIESVNGRLFLNI